MQVDGGLLLRIGLLAKVLRMRFDQRARTIGVTRAQWRTIATVRRAEGATQRRIAYLLEVGEVTAGRLIDKISEQGWVERRADPADRRAYRVYLTQAASPVLEQLEIIGHDEERRALEGLTEAEIRQLGVLLGKVAANLSESVEDAMTV